MVPRFDLEEALGAAREADGLRDFGDLSFLAPLKALLADYASAPLTDLGAHILRSGVVHSLTMRLRAEEWIERHPEIANEVIARPIVVVGMMRSGTTLLQRLLAADPRSTCAYGWEIGEAAPPLDTSWPDPDPRIAAAKTREEQSRAFVPELFAIHPMYAEEAEEEIMFLADSFLSHVPEASADVPDYRAWLDDQDFAPAYDNLHRMLQLLQWQKRRRGALGERWVLKSPAHLGYLDLLRARFPDLHVVHMHRDPRETIPSGASLNATLWGMHMAEVDPHRVGAQWIERMGWTNDRALATRQHWGDDPSLVTDIAFADAINDPLDQVRHIYSSLNLELTDEALAAMTQWLRGRPRESTDRPAYRAEDFGLTAALIDARFREYTERFGDLARAGGST